MWSQGRALLPHSVRFSAVWPVLAVVAVGCGSSSSSGSQPALRLSATTLAFSGTAGSSNPSALVVSVDNAGGGTLSAPVSAVSYGSGSGWLSTAVSGSAAPYAVTAQASVAALAAGTYAATISVSSPGAGNSPQSVGVTLVVEPASWWRDHVAYEVFVRSFADSDGDGIGDLKGLTAHLDDLNDGTPVSAPASTTALGVDAVWLMPIYPSPSYHGYDVADYQSVNPAYGTLADFDAFVAAAHQRGIKVILDMELNHSSRQHPWFLNSEQGPQAADRDWYVWSATDPSPAWQSPLGGSGDPWRPLNGAYYYAVFDSSMPDLNLGNDAVYQALLAAMEFWTGHGVDGFRLDAVRYFFANGPQGYEQRDQPETHAFLQKLRAALQAAFPGTLLVAEAWAPEAIAATYYGQANEVHLAFAFDQAAATLSSVLGGSPDDLVNAIASTETAMAGKDRGFDAPFLTNHDQVRTMRALAADAAGARLAAATLFALPGTPFVYYGEEIGMQGGPLSASSDPDKRTPYHFTATAPQYGFTTATRSWYQSGYDGSGQGTLEASGVDLASQKADPASLWNLYRTLVALRHRSAALANGDATRVAVTPAASAPGGFALVRSLGGQRVLFVANFATSATGPFSVAVTGAPRVLEAEGLALAPGTSGGSLSVPGLAARGFAFIELD